jgi:hypothetical protein
MATADSHLKHEDKFFNFKKELMEDLEKHLTCTTYHVKKCQEMPQFLGVPNTIWCVKAAMRQKDIVHF